MSIDRYVDLLKDARISRKGFLAGALGVLGAAAGLGGPGRLAADTEEEDPYDTIAIPSPVKTVIFLNMNGGMSHVDTLDPKPGQTPFNIVNSSIPGIKIGEPFQKTAKELHRIALLRTTWSEDGDHGFAQYLLNTGYRMPEGGGFPDIPNFGSVLAYAKKKDQTSDSYFPAQVTLGDRFGLVGRPGFLGVKYGGFHIGNLDRPVNHLQPAWGRYSPERLARREQFLDIVNEGFKGRASGPQVAEWQRMFEAALDFMNSERLAVFDIDKEPANVRARFGASWPGRALLMAKRLAAAEMPFIQVTVGGWDTHDNNKGRITEKTKDLDGAIAALLQELDASGLLKQTLFVLSSEFGRTPSVGQRDGRDHFPSVWTTLIGGGDIPRGAVIGATNDKGEREAAGQERRHWRDVMATIYRAAGVDHEGHLTNSMGRPFPFTPRTAKPIAELLPTDTARRMQRLRLS